MPSAAPTEPGGLFYVGRSTSGRIDNPDVYAVLYLAKEPDCAIAETFGRLPQWSASTFVNAKGTPYVVATYELAASAEVFNLDDVSSLASLGVQQVSRIVSRDRAYTQQLARRVYDMGRFCGISWWSYWEPTYTALGIWDLTLLKSEGVVEPLTASSEVVKRTARAIARQVI